ncbi:GroES-like protein, partial [Oesophagostomum dentatum]
VHTVGIGTSDVEFLKRGAAGSIQLTEPIILGHETSGTVDAVGEKVTGFKAGDRVALEPGIPCHKCSQCMIGKYNVCPDVTFFASPPYHGSLTRFVVHDANFCYKLPDNVSYEDGALLEPLSVAVHACRRAQLKMGQSVLIHGAGPIGIMCMMVAKAAGASQVMMTEVHNERLALAKSLGASHTLYVK